MPLLDRKSVSLIMGSELLIFLGGRVSLLCFSHYVDSDLKTAPMPSLDYTAIGLLGCVITELQT